MVSTGTASGKTLAFNLPVLNALAAQPKDRALYLYPTKALAQDQARSLAALGVPKVRAAIYDGDTPSETPLADPQVGERRPHEPGHAPRGRPAASRPLGRRALEPPLRRRGRGARLPRRLRLARGQRPAPPAPRGRDLRRASRSSSSPRRRSRTPASRRPRSLGLDVTVIDEDAAPRAERTVAFWNPPVLDEELGLRASPLGEAARMLADARRERPADDLLREEPPRGGARPPLRLRAARRLACGAALPVPRRVHAGAAARDRAAARRGRAARRHRHGRARARHRRRAARLRHLGRLPGNGREPAPAVGPRGPALPRAGGADRLGRRARPVLHAGAGDAAWAGASRRRSSTTRTRGSSTATSARRRSRRRSTTPTRRRSARRRSNAPRCSPT